MRISSIYPVLCVRDLQASRDFYRDLLGLPVLVETRWYVRLAHAEEPGRQLGLVLIGHESVPSPFSVEPAGVLVSVEVDDVDTVHDRATRSGIAIAQPLRDEDFGQRHFMAVDPDGVLVDVIQPIPPGRGFLLEAARWRRTQP